MILDIAGIVFALISIGFIKMILSLRKLVKDMDFLSQYNHNLVKYLNNYMGKNVRSEEEGTLFVKLISDSSKAQSLLLDAGFIDYKPAGAGYYMKNYQILINTVQSLRNPSLMQEEFSMLNTIIIMQCGRYNELHEEMIRGIKNPIILLREGVQFFTTLPISLLYWTGLIKYSTQYKLSNNIVVKFLNFLIIMFGLVSAIITIVLGWEPFKELFHEFL